MRLHLALPLAIVGLLASPLSAQNTTSQLQELKRQVETLEKQLGSGVASPSRVTEIGGSRTRSRETELVVRIYDVSDLFQIAPPYPAEFQSDFANVERPMLFESTVTHSSGEATGNKGGGFGGGATGMGGGGGFFDVPAHGGRLPGEHGRTLFQLGGKSANSTPANRISIDSLITAITTTISPNTWTESGGMGTIARLGNSLVISTDSETHRKIDALLALFRERWGTLRTVSVRAYWVWLTDAELAELLGNDNHAVAQGRDGYGIVETKDWQALLKNRAEAENNDRRAGYRAAVTCYNGQTVHAQAGGQSLVVTQIDPQVAHGDTGTPEGRVAYRPSVSIVQEGAVLQVTPSATYSGKYVVLDVHTRVTQKEERAKQSEPAQQGEKPPQQDAASPAEVVAALDRPLLLTHRLSTTLRVPVDQPTLIGGMTFSETPAPGEPTLYLFAILSVQELRDDLPGSAAVQANDVDATKPAEADPNGER